MICPEQMLLMVLGCYVEETHVKKMDHAPYSQSVITFLIHDKFPHYPGCISLVVSTILTSHTRYVMFR